MRDKETPCRGQMKGVVHDRVCDRVRAKENVQNGARDRVGGV